MAKSTVKTTKTTTPAAKKATAPVSVRASTPAPLSTNQVTTTEGRDHVKEIEDKANKPKTGEVKNQPTLSHSL